jgi:hypothetical protein
LWVPNHPSEELMDSRRDRYVSEVGSDTVPARLVDLQAVGGSSKRRMPIAVVGAVIVGIVAFALGASLSSPPEPSPTAAVIADLSPDPVPAATRLAVATTAATVLPTASPTPTPRPTIVPSAAPGAWTRSEPLVFDIPFSLDPIGVWAVDGRFIVVVSLIDEFGTRQGWAVAREMDSGWELERAPASISELYGGTVIDGRLWFVARVEGVRPGDAHWELVSTKDGGTWGSRGPSVGIGLGDGIQLVTRVRETWILATWGYFPTGEGAVDSALWWSDDGAHWTKAQVPEAASGFLEYRAAVRADDAVVVGTSANLPRRPPVILTSDGGRTWRTSDDSGILAVNQPTGLACDDLRCVITTEQPCDCTPLNMPTAWAWGGKRWSGSAIPVPETPVGDAALRNLTSTGAGFIAMAGQSGNAVVSRDGKEWLAVNVMPLALSEAPIGLAVNGDDILAVTRSVDGGRVGVWRGSLSLMGG